MDTSAASASAAVGGDWCTIESDPGVFTELLEEIGVEGVELQELWSLDDDSLAALGGTVYGLIFLFQYHADAKATATMTTPKTCLSPDETPSDLFFAHQIATNACATQAMLGVVLNAPSSITLGKTLTEFRSFVADFSPDLKGQSIASSNELKTAHNAFARPEMTFLSDGKFYDRMARNEESEEVYHFVAYLPHTDGRVYELDGLQSGPIVVQDTTTSTTATSESSTANEGSSLPSWLSVARAAIQQRMDASAATGRFNLMAVTQDRRIGIRTKIEEQGNDVDDLQLELARLEEQRMQWKKENQRRRHNYVPLCIALLRALAASSSSSSSSSNSGGLTKYIEEAKERKKKAKAGAGK